MFCYFVMANSMNERNEGQESEHVLNVKGKKWEVDNANEKRTGGRKSIEPSVEGQRECLQRQRTDFKRKHNRVYISTKIHVRTLCLSFIFVLYLSAFKSIFAFLHICLLVSFLGINSHRMKSSILRSMCRDDSEGDGIIFRKVSNSD